MLVKDDLGANSKILRGTEAVEFIKSELLAIETDVQANVGPGRISKGAVWGLLARLYLNAAVYRDPYGTPAFKPEDMDKVVEYTDKIISSGQYALAKEYFSIFDSDNHTNKELVFAVDQRADLNGHNRGILRGQQYGLLRVNGAFLKCPDGKMKVGKLFSASRNKPTLAVDFSEKIDFTVQGSNYSSGYRVEKYEFSKKSTSGRNFGEADISIVRLADVYLMRAEAKLRKGGGEAAALADVNTVRAARTARGTPPPALTTMNLDLLYRERGFELYWEMIRRTDMIRFGKYEDSWTEKTSTDKKKRLLPIPQTAIDGASNLPGYLKQNDSY